MGKKKSVVIMALLTIVIVVLCAITAFPVFTIPGTNGIKSWNPAVMQYDLGMDLGGGYYAYYYPVGVISESEYENNLVEESEEKEEYVRHGGLYLNTDEEYGIVENVEKDAEGNITSYKVQQSFIDGFNAAAKEVSARFAAKGYSEHRVSIVDDYAIKVELPASEASENYTALQSASQALSLFALTGELQLQNTGEVIDEMNGEEVSAKDLIKSIKTKTKYEVTYIEIKFTELGKEAFKEFKAHANSSSDSSDSGSATFDFAIENYGTLFSVDSSNMANVVDGDMIKYSIAEDSDKRYVETMVILLNSALNGGFEVEFRELTSSEVRTFAPVYNENVWYFVLGALLAALVGFIVFGIVKMGRYGVVNMYANLSYVIITALCYAFITKGVLPVTFGSILIFLIGLVLVNVFHHFVYGGIKSEFVLGKTVESSVKGGNKKTLWAMIDVYAVLLLASLALLISAGAMQTFATQALICVISAAFVNILWSRGINFVFLSASKDKYKYFRFVREDDDDE